MAAGLTSVKPLAGGGLSGHLVAMADKDKEREERLAAALRENLRRRKAQARELSDDERNERDKG